MKKNNNKKDCIDPATTSVVGIFLFKSIAQAFVGWISLEFFKKYLNYFRNRRNKNENIDGEIPDQKPAK